jgi:hypothetical protein
MSKTFKISSSAVAKTIKRYDETVSHYRCCSSLELPASEIAAHINAHRVQGTDTSQHQLFRGDCVNQAFMVELLQIYHY